MHGWNFNLGCVVGGGGAGQVSSHSSYENLLNGLSFGRKVDSPFFFLKVDFFLLACVLCAQQEGAKKNF